jgi:hypothetical protein
MPRYFTLAQAEQVLPAVTRSIREGIALKQSYEQAEGELSSVRERIMLLGGSLVDRRPLLECRNRRDSLASQLNEAIERIQQHGCLVKDLDLGLIDFPTLFRGEEVYLCWKLGEDAIQFWHGMHEGYRGRKEIDREFLEQHRGEEEGD